MPPDSTQNLNAMLSAPRGEEPPERANGIHWEASSIQSSGPPVRIVGATAPYRGGYHVEN